MRETRKDEIIKALAVVLIAIMFIAVFIIYNANRPTFSSLNSKETKIETYEDKNIGQEIFKRNADLIRYNPSIRCTTGIIQTSKPMSIRK